jgi:protein-tyrosine phosphatase
MAEPPLPGSYWVHSGLLAGRYPRDVQQDLPALLAAGITLFLDLTEVGELPPYEPLLPKGIEHLRMPIRDFTAPIPQRMELILQALGAALSEGRTVYLHCHGGIGRTGTVVGCHLVRRGHTGAAALLEIRRLRLGPGCAPDSPETEAQRTMVLQWPQERSRQDPAP